MEQDPELIAAFAEEIQQLENDLLVVVKGLKQNIDQPPLFAKFGNLIDRIYGTAATFGFKELAAYSGAMKKTCYDCSATINKRAYSRVLIMIEKCLELLGALRVGIHDQEVDKKINYNLAVELGRGKKIYEEIFQFDKKKTAV